MPDQVEKQPEAPKAQKITTVYNPLYINWKNVLLGTLIAVLIVAIAVLSFTFLFQDTTPVPSVEIKSGTQSSKIATRSSTALDEKFIIKSVDFTNSSGEKKKFVIYGLKEKSGYKAVYYISDESNSEKTLIKIGDSGCSAIDFESLQACLGAANEISVSSGSEKKYIALYITNGDATTITIFSEEGKILVEPNEINKNIFSVMGNLCQCHFTFEKWASDATFYIKVSTESGTMYRLLVDAETGKFIGEKIKI